MKIGLNKQSGGDDASIAMLPSWITRHPTGQELGEYLGLDLSGSYIRVYLVTLHGQGRITTRQMKYTVKKPIKQGSINKLVEFMAECVESFLNFINKSYSKDFLSLGLCIAFPLRQTAINNAVVLRWTKDFDIAGGQNKNIVELLQTAFRKREMPVIVKAAINGASYWEKTSDIGKLDPSEHGKEMIINTEWGSFGDSRSDTIPHTFYDVRVNRQSVNPGIHVYEKMVAGLYLGEIVRLVLVDFLDRRLIFDGQYSTEMNKAYNFESSYVSAIDRDETAQLEDTKHLLEQVMNIPSTTITDRRMVKKICELVGKRAARLIAAGISSIITKRRALEVGLSISVEGIVYEHYSNFPDRVNHALRELYGDYVDRINIGVSRTVYQKAVIFKLIVLPCLNRLLGTPTGLELLWLL
ncbi:hexokinase-domain-containing protein [Sporodiniella umbellata]|nr:hexokinase-domain-containing protein [Sporodiniella umbellata]